jgi:acyl carrier protein
MNTAETESFTRVRELLIQDFRIKPRKVTPEARIREDLGICGADGVDLFDALHEQCGVDLTGYDHERYFEPECWSAGAFFTKKWWTTFRHPQSLTVAQLAKAVAGRKWEDADAQQSDTPNPRSPSAHGFGGR